MRTVICDYCGKRAQYMDSSVVYHGISFGMIYYCPDCQAWVGVHRGTDKPLGRLANAELRQWKRIAHDVFDRIWKGNRHVSRQKAYKWLSIQMDLPEDLTHIGLFDIEQCKRVIELSKQRLEAKENAQAQ